jgi:hypothetical protein
MSILNVFVAHTNHATPETDENQKDLKSLRVHAHLTTMYGCGGTIPSLRAMWTSKLLNPAASMSWFNAVNCREFLSLYLSIGGEQSTV